MDIAEVAKRSGVPASTLRYYEERGLISSSGRRGLRRTFSPSVLERLALIALGQAAGFTLDEIRPGSGGRPRIDRNALAHKADELDRRIKRLKAVRDGLRHAAVCSAPHRLDCPTFRRLMGLAAAGAVGGVENRPRRRRNIGKRGSARRLLSA